MPAASPALNSDSKSRVNCSTACLSSDVSVMMRSLLVCGKDGDDQVVDYVPGEFGAEGAVGGHLPEQVRLDHLMCEAGQFRVSAGGQFAAPDGAADDRQGGRVTNGQV